MSLPADRYAVFSTYSYAALGGLLGGVLFALKWLYHSVAKGTWNRDRRLWRVFAPLISSGLSFAVLSLGIAGLIPLVDEAQLRRPSTIVGTSFLVGYFSDNAIAALAELAKRLFGSQPPK